MAALKLNRLPSPTFSWLHVNSAEVSVQELSDSAPELAVPAGVTLTQAALQKDGIPETCSEELGTFLADQQTQCSTLTGSSAEPVRMQLEQNGVSALCIDAKAGAALTVIQYLHADTAIQTVVRTENSASVKLVQIFDSAQIISDTAAVLEDSAKLELVQVYLGGGSTVSGTTVTMNGTRSVFQSQIGYRLDGSDRLDLNQNIIQNGRKSESQTEVKGVLRGAASKVFRGTIDFRHGAVGAEGAENEDVLLMDETVQNKTVPVILCAEEDVAGSHGASIGQISPEHIFYMQSRGIPAEQIIELMAQTKLGTVIRQIGDPQTERSIYRRLGREDLDE